MKAFHVNRKEFLEIFKGSGKYSMKLHQNAVATWPLVNHNSCLCKALHVWLPYSHLISRKTKSHISRVLRRLATVFLALACIFWSQNFAFSWYNTTFSTNYQRLFSHWFPSNSCHHSNGNGQHLILNNVEYLENYPDILWRNLNYLNYSTYTTCMRN